MARYKEYNQAQGQFISIDFGEQLMPGTFEHALNHIVDHELDLSVFDEAYKNEETGAPAFDPRVLLKIVLYAYSRGITSSRKIERECQTNVIFMALSANTRPHFTTIADFISSMEDKAKQLFTDVVLLCDQLGLIGKSMFAIDGCKISSNASKEWSGKREDFERRKMKMEKEVKKLLKRHREQDERKGEVKDQAAKEKQAIENYKKKIRKLADFLKDNDDRMGTRGKPIQSNITDNESAKMTSSHGVIQGYNGVAAVDSKNQVIVEAQAFGSGSEHQLLEPLLEGAKENLGLEDLEGTVITADTGFHSEDSLEYLASKHLDGYVPDPKFRQRDPKFDGRERHDRSIDRKGTTRSGRRKFFKVDDFKYDSKYDQMICPAGETLYKAGVPVKVDEYLFQRYKGRDSKCPSCSLRSKCIQGKKSIVKQLYIQLKKEGKKSFSHKMKDKIDTPKGRFIYSRRMGVVEPVFAHICKRMRLDYFTVKSKRKVNTQWKLFAIVHNLKKLYRFAPLFA